MIEALAEFQVRRKFYIGLTNKQTNAAKALVRRQIGWRYDDEESKRETVNKRAARIVSLALAGKEQAEADHDIGAALGPDLVVVASVIEPLAKARHQVESDMKRTARALPVWQAWAKDVKGLGELGLAVIVAEAGDLTAYPDKGKLWRRLGLAPFNDKACSTWRREGGLTAEEWTVAGYSPRRRAEIYAVVAEPLFRSQTVAGGPYRAAYDHRRAHTYVTHPDWTKMHSHMDAMRYMTKRLIRDLWQAWRDAERGASTCVPKGPVPLALPPQPIEAKAKAVMPERAGHALPTPQPDELAATVALPKKAKRKLLPVHPSEREAKSRMSAKAKMSLPTVHPIHYGDLP